ncbi:MAG: laccase domain-containing protein, partial [Acidimicrobiales bacterium]
CIRSGCYEFAGPELEELIGQFGSVACGTTMWGTPSLDVPALVAAELRAAGVVDLSDEAGCTACDRRWYSHRARREVERFATVGWVPSA